MHSAHFIKRVYCFLAVCFFGCFSASLASAAPAADKSCLWEIKAGPGRVYLLGSVHLLKEKTYPLKNPIEKAYRDSDTVVFETDLDGLNDPAFQLSLAASAMYLDGSRLKDKLPEKSYLRVKKRMAAYGLPFENFQLYRPWFCALAMSVAELRRQGLDPDFGVDRYFFKRAGQDRKKRDFFETGAFQLDLFRAMGELNQVRFLEQTLEDIVVMEKMFPKLLTAWENGNTEMLDRIINKSFKDFPKIYERFITQRNNNWLPRIEKWINSHQRVMIIVGTGHLVGEKGLVSLLSQRGYDVRQQ